MQIIQTLKGFFALSLTSLISILHADYTESVFELDDLVVIGNYLHSEQVSALKSPTPIEDVPQSVSILTADLLELQNLSDMAAIADYVPGIVAGQGEGHRDDILFRGQKSTADFFVDGVRDDVQYYRPLYNIEQVEVLKGANALLFGRGGTGGLINRVSKVAQFNERFTHYTLSFDEFGSRGFQIDINKTISPHLAVRLNYYSEDLENHRDFYYADNSGINPTLSLALTEQTQLNLSFETLDHERYIDRGIPSINGKPVESLKGTTFGSSTENHSSLDAKVFKLCLDHKLNERTKLRLKFTDNDFDKLYQNLYAKSYDSANDTLSLEGYRDTTDRSSRLFSADLIGEKEIGGMNHRYILGFERIETSNDNERFYADTNGIDDATKGDLITLPISDPLAIPSFNFSTEKYDETEAELSVQSIFFSDEIALSNQFDLIIGGRLDAFELSVKDVEGRSGGDASKKDEVFSPRLGFVYKPVESISYYASYSESYLPKSGEQYADLKGDAKQKTDPDVYENKEIGAKFNLLNGIGLTLAYFDLTAKKPQYISDNEYELTEQSVQGYEFQAIGSITKNWFLSAGASILTQGYEQPEVPEKTYSIWNLYTLNDKLSLGIGLVHKDASIGKGSTDLPAYNRIDAAAYYQISDHLRLQLNVENLMDALYYPHSYGAHQVSVGAPVNASIKIVGRF